MKTLLKISILVGMCIALPSCDLLTALNLSPIAPKAIVVKYEGGTIIVKPNHNTVGTVVNVEADK